MNTIKPNTHQKINSSLSGVPVEITSVGSKVSLLTTEDMAADEMGLIHGGFVFSLADYAAMIAVNQPNVVLGKANAMFLKPVKVGEQLMAIAEIQPEEGKKKPVNVKVLRGDDIVFKGEFICFVTNKHVLEG